MFYFGLVLTVKEGHITDPSRWIVSLHGETGKTAYDPRSQCTRVPPGPHHLQHPLRSLVPVGVANLLVASRSFSATSEAAGSARVVPTTMAMGQAAGVVAALCARRGCTPAEAARTSTLLAEVHRVLRSQGV